MRVRGRTGRPTHNSDRGQAPWRRKQHDVRLEASSRKRASKGRKRTPSKTRSFGRSSKRPQALGHQPEAATRRASTARRKTAGRGAKHSARKKKTSAVSPAPLETGLARAAARRQEAERRHGTRSGADTGDRPIGTQGRPIRCRPGGPPAPQPALAAAGGRRDSIAPVVNCAKSKKPCRDRRRAWISTVVRRRHGAAVTNCTKRGANTTRSALTSPPAMSMRIGKMRIRSATRAPGGDNPTPDQDRVDDIGKALGVQYDDNEELKASDKISRARQTPLGARPGVVGRLSRIETETLVARGFQSRVTDAARQRRTTGG